MRMRVSRHIVAGVVFSLASILPRAGAADLAGVTVALDAYQGPARVAADLVAPYRLVLKVDPAGETSPLAIRVNLPTTGPRAWPAADVEVRDDGNKAMMVRRPGIEWAKLTIPVPPAKATYFVQAVDPAQPAPKRSSDSDRIVTDTGSGLRFAIAKWHGGKRAALSIRFDDSHPTHLTKAVPILNEYGFKGTFMVNPGPAEPGSRQRFDFVDHRTEWADIARRGDHEIANHSAHHRGAKSDEEMESEIGEAAKAIWQLAPNKSKLMALNLGGGTYWETTRTLRYYLDKYHQFDASGNSTGMDDSYGKRVETLRRMLEQHLERGLWLRTHYHYIGDGLSTSEANFRAAMDVIKERQASLWIAGMADIHKYQTERDAARLIPVESSTGRVAFRLACSTDEALYNQPLTVEVTDPKGSLVRRLTVRDSLDKVIAEIGGTGVHRFDLPPHNATYSVAISPSR